MTLKLPDISTDSSTARLISVAQAVQLTGDLPTASAKTLVASAKAVRLYLLAHETAAAEAVLAEIDRFTETAEGPDLAVMVRRHTDAVRKAINPRIKAPEIRSAVARPA